MNPAPLLGCIADDFTGATDLAAMLVRGGMRVVQLIGVPAPGDQVPAADAVVVALKSRTATSRDAVADSVAALDRLRDAGCRQFFFKYCSTFDSSARGNIGPVADALLERLGSDFAVACPAAPANGRTVYQGHLFVGDRLLSESGMEHHPLTPMRDPDLVRVLSGQTTGKVGLVGHDTVRRGGVAIGAALRDMAGARYAIVDAITAEDLRSIGAAVADHTLVTGAAGLAMGLPENFRLAGLLPGCAEPEALPAVGGHAAVLAGSCSRATLAQLEAARAHLPVLELDPLTTLDAQALSEQALSWAESRLGGTPVVIAASTTPNQVELLQSRLGRAHAGALVENALAAVAEGLVARGVRRLVVAGGETSGAVVSRLGVRSLRVGPEIDPGVPWTWAQIGDEPLLLSLKSGNFGSPGYFLKAFGLHG